VTTDRREIPRKSSDASQPPVKTSSPRPWAISLGAAKYAVVYCARRPASITADRRVSGCSQNGWENVRHRRSRSRPQALEQPLDRGVAGVVDARVERRVTGTVAPTSPSAIAIPLPTPRVAPVTTATVTAPPASA
jgi:hypothetical protein